MVVNTSDLKYASKTSYRVRITLALPESSGATVTYYFELVIKHICADNELTLTGDL